MKLFNSIILTLFTVIFSFQSNAQRAKDGDYTVTSLNDVVNTYTSASAVSGTVLTVANNAMNGAHFSGNLQAGDLIMIYQAYGASVNIDVGMYTFGFTNPATIANGYLWSGDWDQHLEEFGEVTGYSNAGKFEQVEVASVSGGTIINLQCGLKNTYDFNKRVQVIRVPRFNNLTVNNASSIVPSPWNGVSGGIVAIEIETTLTVNAGGLIQANGFGFRGGQLDATGQAGDASSPNQWRFLGVDRPEEGSEHGEGIYGYHTEYDLIYSRYGIGAIANAGGGGGYQNAGGGGGSNISPVIAGYSGNGVPNPTYNTAWALDISGLPGTARTPINGTSTPGGGRGGYALAQNDQNELAVGPRNSSWGGDARKTNGGLGGHPLSYDATRLFFGGGGGAGDQDGGQGGAGGAGGGIVHIVSYGTIVGSGNIEANGANGQNSNPNNMTPTGGNPRRGNDGAGGGGGGGAIYIESASAISGTLNLNARGGNGGNQNIRLLYSPPFVNTSDEAGGPGGSGAGGSIALSAGAPAQNVTAGSNGVVTSERGTGTNVANYTPNPSAMVANFPPNGATNGSVGISGLPAPYYDLQISDVTTCSTPVNLTVTVLGSIPSGGTIGWYTNQFGGAPFATGASTSVSPASTTTYYVGVCPGSFRIPVTVTVVSSPNLTITNPSAVCAPGTVDITAAAVTAGSDAGTLTYWTNAGATTTYSTPSNATNGTYYIQLDIGGGCTTVEPVTVTVTPAPATPTISAGSATTFCVGGSVTLSSSAATGNQWYLNGSPIGGATAQTYVANAAGDYTVISTVSGCPSAASAATTVTINPTPPTPTISAGGPTTFCAGGSVTLTSSTSSGNQWYFNGSPIGGATAQTYVASNSGDFTVISTVSGCSSPASNATTITVTPTPATPTITASGSTSFCTGGSVTLNSSSATGNQWYLNGSPIGGATNQSFNATAAGDYTVIVTTSGCPSNPSAINTVTIVPNPVITIGTVTNPTSCGSSTGSIQINGSVTGVVSWTGAASGNSGTVTLPYTITGLAAGTYNITVSVGSCNSNTLVQGLTDPSAPATPTISSSGPTTFCTGGSVTLTSSSATGNQWSLGGVPIGGETGQTIVVSSSGDYTVFVTSGGCTSSASAITTVTVNPIPSTPTIAAGGVTTFCSGGSVVLSSSASAGNQWYLNGAPISGATATTYNASVGGDYTVVVTELGCSSNQSAITSVTVNPSPAAPTISAGGPTDFCAGGSVTLTSSSASGNQWYLNGSPIGGATNQTFAASSGGDYTVVETTAGCSSPTSAITTVNVTPTPVISTGIVSNPTACGATDGSIQISGTETGILSWTGTSSGNTGVVTLPQTISGLGAGSYNIVFTVNGCPSNTIVQGLTDPSAPATPTVVASGPTTFCGSGSVTLTSSSSTGNQWALNGTPIAGANNQTIVVNASGDYTVMVTSGGCSSAPSTITTVTVNPIPAVNASNSGPVCIGSSFNLMETGGDATSWSWTTSGGGTITNMTDQNPSVSGAADGDVFTVMVTDANACTNTSNTTVSIIQSPILDPIADVVNCGPYTLPAIQGTNLTGSESYYDNAIASGGVQISGPINSTQTVWVYDGIATCEDEISFLVTINPIPTVVSVTGGGNYCNGDVINDIMVEVSGTPDWSINYTLNGVSQNVVSSISPISLGNAEGVYVITSVTDVNCSNTVNETQTIVVTNTPAQPVASEDVTYCNGDLIVGMTVSGSGGTYTWYTDNALNSIYGTGSIITPQASTQTYYVTETVNGCESSADDILITVENCEIIYPTAFTPDGDGVNDTWEIVGLDEKYPDNIVRIYNRWGNLIFEHTSSITNPYDNNRWDGTYKGAPLPVGSFYYIIDVSGTDEKIKGTVSIILN